MSVIFHGSAGWEYAGRVLCRIDTDLKRYSKGEREILVFKKFQAWLTTGVRVSVFVEEAHHLIHVSTIECGGVFLLHRQAFASDGKVLECAQRFEANRGEDVVAQPFHFETCLHV